MEENESKYKLNMAVPNGIILGLIGLLVVVTPLTTSVSGNHLIMDLVAGTVLIVGGSVSLVLGLRRRR